ncbi:SBBP repeat-containing protein [Prochlorococcus marinus]|uniref:Na-Ca exchanger/integrin-beta4 n=1 Tax=Prochlorococcus marinus str. SB TaxID=59926 RepID=A0A0A2B746_PROMR|nr:SBBP repeat-containing protein [Prochlorococcus marinus]KGG08429.1 Na-Ca exchanger/integrin-beta4 [Prochlorococcus marinus str. SB]
MTTEYFYEWVRLLGTSSREDVGALTTGSDGSIYIAGSTAGNLDDQISYGSDQDAFISKFNPDGTREWTRLLGSQVHDYGQALTTGSDGSIYIAGTTSGDLDGQINSGDQDTFICKFSPDGTKEWTKLLGTSYREDLGALTTGSDGSIYVAGMTNGDLDGQTNYGGNAYGGNVASAGFISKYHPDGTKEWTRLFGSVGWSINDVASALTTGSDGSIYVAGYTAGRDAFISKFSPDGEKQWNRLLGSYATIDYGNALTTGSDGSIYVAGMTSGDLDGQINYLINDAFISKFSPDGTKEWTRLVGTYSFNTANALTTGLDGSIYIAGRTETNNQDAFISKFNPDGKREWTTLIGSSLYEDGSALTTGSDGSIYIAGTTNGDLDGQTNNGGLDAFISRMSFAAARLTFSYAPTDIFLSETSFNEHINSGVVVATLSTTDPEFIDSHNYQFISGTGDTDNAFFTIEGSNLKINSSPDYENKSSYSVRLKTTDLGGLSYEEQVTLNVNDINEVPTDIYTDFDSGGYIISENISSESVFTTLRTSDIDDSDFHTYSLVSGEGDEDNELFTIQGDQLKINISPDYETQSSYNVRLKTIDSGELSYEEAFTFYLRNLNEIATDISLSSTSFNENISSGSVVATLSTTDDDSSDSHTYSLVSGAGDTNNSLFTIEGSSLKINSSPDYENNSSYSIRLKTTDRGGLFYEEAVTLRVNDLIDQTPTDISTSSTSFNENISSGSVVATLSTTDEDASDSHTYELASGTGDTDNALFTIEGSELKINSSPDYETKSSYSVRLKTTDSGGLSYEEAFTFSVNDVNEVATDISLSSGSFNENIDAGSTVATLSTTDEDASDTHTYSLVSGIGDTDNNSFTIEGSELKINSSPDYETQSSYIIRLKTTDSGGLSYEEAVTLTVNDLIDETPKDIFLNVPEFEWTKLLETYSPKDLIEAGIIGSDGSVYIAGETEGNLDGQPNNGDDDVFISKFSADGEKQWTQLIGSSKNEEVWSITTGPDGSVYIAGGTQGNLDGQNNSSGDDAFISKFSADGEKQWTKLFGTYGEDNAWGITTGPDGSVYITGETRNGYDDAFINKFSADGEKQWTQLIGSNQEDEGRGITIGSDGYIYIVGATKGDIDGETNPSNNAQYDWDLSQSRFSAFISKLSVNGEKIWTQIFGSLGEDDAFEITTGLDGSVYIAGETTGDLDGQTNSGDNDPFITKFSADGEKQWTKLLGTSYEDVGYALTKGLDGSIYITGYTYGDLDGQTNSGITDAFISKFSADGEKQWTKLFGSSEGDSAAVLATGLDGSIKILHGTGNFDNTKLYVSKFIDNGNTINENIEAGSIVANLSTNDANLEDTHSYTLVSGDGDTDNALFTIDGSNLKINSSPDYETKDSYNIRLKTTDSAGFSYEEAFTFNVNELDDLNESPILSSSNWILNINDLHLTLTGSSDINGTGNIHANTIKGNSGKNTLDGGIGDDILYGNGGKDILFGGLGEDTLYGGTSSDILYGGDDNDKLYGGSSSDTLYGDKGDDYLKGHSSSDILYGGEGNDHLRGGTSSDKLYGGIGNDLLKGESSSDELYGEDGDDELYGGTSADKLYGGIGNDKLYGDSSADKLYGNDGDDYLEGGSSKDRLSGGNGDDELHGGTSADKLYGGAGADQLYGDTGDDYLKGHSGDDILYGGEDDDYLRGGDDGDYLYGESGDDKLKGENGNDILTGGLGKDDLYGGSGNDVFKLTAGSGYDRIRDFKKGEDKVDIDGFDFNSIRIVDTGKHSKIYNGSKDLLAIVYNEDDISLSENSYLI